MLTTLLLSVILMAALFLLLYAGVALIQDKRFFSSAPKAVQDAVRPKAERFHGQHALGWGMAATALLLFPAAFLYGAWDGARQDFTFWQFAFRFAVMLYLLKAFDILVFDWILLCNGHFFPRYYPEVRPVLGPHLFGYNRKEHLTHMILFIPAALLKAWAATMLWR